MHWYHLISNVSRPDWCLICHSHRQKAKSPSVLFFTSSPFFSSQSFFQHPLQVCDRFQTGWEARTMCFDPQYRPPAQCPATAPSPSRPWGGLAAAPLSTSHLHPSATTRINRSVTPYKRSTEVNASHHSAPPTMTSHVAQDWERGSKNKMESYYR